jgi:tRNA pseudouridine13 synthase
VFEIPEWPHFLGKPQASGLIRSCPEDFVVEEIPRVSPVGEGFHLWLWVEKRSTNTDWVARELAKAAACPLRDVGYAGLKDRHAVTRQWFSVPLSDLASEKLAKLELENVTVLEIHKHTRKLKRGTLDGNRFHLKIRAFKGDIAEAEQRLQQIKSAGVPNYFGPQRFGRHGGNVEKGYSMLKNRARMPRNKKSIYLSAIRSFMYNHVLAERVRMGNWNTMLDGELAMLDGTQSIFPCELSDTEIEDRCKRLDIHPTGPLPGEKGTQVTAAVAELEQSVLSKWPELCEVLVSDRVQASRRSLRLIPGDLEWEFASDTLELSFTLPPGAYATVVLRELLIASEAERI